MYGHLVLVYIIRLHNSLAWKTELQHWYRTKSKRHINFRWQMSVKTQLALLNSVLK